MSLSYYKSCMHPIVWLTATPNYRQTQTQTKPNKRK